VTDGELSARFQSDVIPLREPLHRHAMRMTRNHADAEDLVQDTLVKAYAYLQSFKQGTNFRSWLFRIMTNSYINGYRKKQRQPAHYPSGLTTDALLATAEETNSPLRLTTTPDHCDTTPSAITTRQRPATAPVGGRGLRAKKPERTLPTRWVYLPPSETGHLTPAAVSSHKRLWWA